MYVISIFTVVCVSCMYCLLALLRMDENTLKYQVERMQAEVDKLKQDAIKSKQAAIESDAENQKLREQAKNDQARIAELERLLKEAHTV